MSERDQSAWNPDRSYFQFCNCCGGNFSNTDGARAFIRHTVAKLQHGVIFTTIVPTMPGVADPRVAWLAGVAGRAVRHLEALAGRPLEVSDVF